LQRSGSQAKICITVALQPSRANRFGYYRLQMQDRIGQLAELLEGVSALELATALDAIHHKREISKQQEKKENKNFLNQKYFMPGEECFIYQRGDTKKKIWYIHIYDIDSKKQYIRSLKTTDEVKAITAARLIFSDISGKISRGERIVCITTQELVDKYLEKESRRITDKPQDGITPARYRVKKQCLRVWLDYIEFIGCKATPIDKINPEKTREFGYWYFKLPKGGPYKDDGIERSKETINNAITEVIRCYKQVALRDRYISVEQIPQIDRLTSRPDEGRGTKDILELDEYEILYKYLRYKYTTDKSATEDERLKRRMFANVVGILANTGLRPKELLGLYWHEVKVNKNDSRRLQRSHRLITIRQDNSKTGRSRTVNAPVGERVDRIKGIYKDLNCQLKPDDYFLLNPFDKDRKSYTREILAKRLKMVLEESGLQAKLNETGRNITLYSFRHMYITWRLRYGQVPIQLVAKNCGTSINMIEKTYGHISTVLETEVLTKNQGYAITASINLAD